MLASTEVVPDTIVSLDGTGSYTSSGRVAYL